MAAALTIAVLLAISVMVVRVAAVAMRLTGLPESVARFQSISALTGTGFTTHEAEMIVNYPIRRKILVALMIVGNLGLVSLASTFIVTFVDSGRTSVDATLVQLVTIVAAAGVVFMLTTNKALDRSMCKLVGAMLSKATSLGKRRYLPLLQLDEGHSIAEHVFHGAGPQLLSELALEEHRLHILALRAGDARDITLSTTDHRVTPGDVIICFGPDRAHDDFETSMLGENSVPGQTSLSGNG